MTTNTPTSITIKKTTTTQSVVANDSSSSNPLATTQVSAPCNVSVGLTRAHQQAVHYYPGRWQQTMENKEKLTDGYFSL